jgi:hypothetical protein
MSSTANGCRTALVPFTSVFFFCGLFYNALSVTRIYNIDDRVTSE